MNNRELVAFAKSKLGTNYVYGAKGEVLTANKYSSLKELYPSYVWDSDSFKIGTVCVDCSGLISWATKQIKSSSMYKNEASEIHDISTIESAPVGVAVWRQGHIGIYAGSGFVIEARGSKHGVVISDIEQRDFTHWFKLSDIEYLEENVEYYPAFKSTNSIFECLESLGIDADYWVVNRIAKRNGISDYIGTVEQNLTLVDLLNRGLLKKE